MYSQRRLFLLTCLLFFLLVGVYAAYAWNPLPVRDDPLVRMPGTQPDNGVALQSPNRCLNCHGGYNQSVEPGFNWMGSMMAQSARDFLYWSCLTVAAQDSIFALGNPNAVDICERCHFPGGWLGGRSDPPNASAMTGDDYDGVQCDFCHRMYDPFFEDSYAGAREGDDWLGYWDEAGTLSQAAADGTYLVDMAQAQAIPRFSGLAFFTNDWPDNGLRPFSSTYTENTSGQYFVSSGGEKRASFADAGAKHQMLYSRYHKSKYFCGTCHDVSNPILANLGLSGLANVSGDLITEQYSAASYFHVERTFSEFMLSAYGEQGGAPTNPEFQAQGAPDITHAAKCQDCHMRDEVGQAANKGSAVLRPNDSVEHPQSGQPLHDLTGGNAWVPYVLASSVPGSPNYDSVNDALLNQGSAALTLDLTQGLGLDPAALLAGVDRAKQQLALAATIKNVSYNAGNGQLTFQIQNNTAHKLISGFPEGRRMFVNIKAYAGDSLIYEANPYDATAGSLKGLAGYTYSDPDGILSPPAGLGANELYVDELVYEMHPTVAISGAYTETESFHFALATGRYKDNRIPPKGFRIDEAGDRQSVPVWHGVEDPTYFTVSEYANGYDEVNLTIAPDADRVEINLYYQTTSREYIEFLRNEINSTAGQTTLPLGAYIAQADPFFGQLRAWGDTLWNLWTHNMDVPGAAPFLMAQSVVGGGGACTAPTPTLLSAAPGHTTVSLSWSDEHSASPDVTGYNLYYDQAGKAQLVANLDLTTTYLDSGLTDGQEYCYKVSAVTTCESAYSNIVCAIPNNQGQAKVGVSNLETGRYETTGKGKNQTTAFVLTDLFSAGDEVVFRAHVYDAGTGLPVANVAVDVAITGPESTSLTATSDANGVAEVTWPTQQPNKRGQGGTTPGTYTATVVNVAANGYTWDQVMVSATFIIQ